MTEAELNEVRELKKEIQAAERQLRILKTAAENLVPVLDGLPHAQNPKSRVASIATLIIDAERALTTLKEKLDSTGAKLIARIRREPLTTREQEILILRYVACMNFRDIEFKLHLSDARVFSYHRSALKKVTVDRQLTDSKATVRRQLRDSSRLC